MPTTSPPRSVAVLDSAVTWTHGCLEHARTAPLDLPTPCLEWDLGDLLEHMDDSLVAIGEAAQIGRVRVDRAPARASGPLVDRIVLRACHTRAAWLDRLTSAPVEVGDLALGRDTLVYVGALEIAIHGWDVAQSCGAGSRLPEDLAARLYAVALAVVTPAERGRRFGPPVAVAADAPVSTRLLAHLGRIG